MSRIVLPVPAQNTLASPIIPKASCGCGYSVVLQALDGTVWIGDDQNLLQQAFTAIFGSAALMPYGEQLLAGGANPAFTIVLPWVTNGLWVVPDQGNTSVTNFEFSFWPLSSGTKIGGGGTAGGTGGGSI